MHGCSEEGGNNESERVARGLENDVRARGSVAPPMEPNTLEILSIGAAKSHQLSC